MKKYILFSLLASIFLFAFNADLNAQQSGKKKKKTTKTDEYFDESGGDWTQKLWYGTGGNLGFTGGNNYSVLQLGISPMVGYKLTPNISVGPRLSFLYTGYKGGTVDVTEFSTGYVADNQTFSDVIQRLSTVDIGIGAFARVKFLRNFFVHAEYENYTSKFPGFEPSGRNVYFWRDSETLEFLKFKENRSNGNIGIGYNSGLGELGYEIMALYNVLLPADDLSSPIGIRAGLTYRF